MNISPDVISDLLPLYLAGEASAGTRALLEEYLREHPGFREGASRTGRAQHGALDGANGQSGSDLGSQEDDARTGAPIQPVSKLPVGTCCSHSRCFRFRLPSSRMASTG